MQTKNSIIAKLEHYCAYQERCHFEVEQKARTLGANKEETNLALYHLIQNNYLNEERFAELYARSKMNQKKWGSHKIQQGLFNKRVSSALITSTLNSLPSKLFIENGLALCIKSLKNQPLQKTNFKEVAKLKKMLFSKGYSASVIEKVLKHENL